MPVKDKSQALKAKNLRIEQLQSYTSAIDAVFVLSLLGDAAHHLKLKNYTLLGLNYKINSYNQ